MSKHFCIFNIIIILICIVAGAFFSLFFGSNIEVAQTLSYLETLTTISSILLGVMGVWLSLIWDRDGENRKENINYIKISLIISLVIITVFLISRQIYPIMIQINMFMLTKIKCIIRSLFFFTSIILTLLTILSVFMAVLSFDFFSFDTDVQEIQEQTMQNQAEELFRLTQSENRENV